MSDTDRPPIARPARAPEANEQEHQSKAADDPSWYVGFVPFFAGAPDLHCPVLMDDGVHFFERLHTGLCPICGERYGADYRDWSSLRRVDGCPGRWEHPTWEWLGPCGHRVRAQRKGAKAPPGTILPAAFFEKESDFNTQPHRREFSIIHYTDNQCSDGLAPITTGNDTHALGELLAHQERLLSEGWRPTRWKHPTLGEMELVVSDGCWISTLPDGTISCAGPPDAFAVAVASGRTEFGRDSDGNLILTAPVSAVNSIDEG